LALFIGNAEASKLTEIGLPDRVYVKLRKMMVTGKETGL
jgi:hypothetical protein